MCVCHGVCQHNLIGEMPEKFDEMLLRWHEACEDEAVSNYMPEDSEAIKVRTNDPAPPPLPPSPARGVLCTMVRSGYHFF